MTSLRAIPDPSPPTTEPSTSSSVSSTSPSSPTLKPSSSTPTTQPAAPPTPPLSPSPHSSTTTFALCIAHYNEPLDWLRPIASTTTIYSKGHPLPTNNNPFPTTQQHTLPNIGRETHTYLTHIVRHYAYLPDITLFLQGDIHGINDGTPAHTDLTLAEIVAQTKELKPGAVMPVGKVCTFEKTQWGGLRYKEDWVRRRGKTLVRSKHTPGEFWGRVLFPEGAEAGEGRQLPKEVRFVQGACYAVTREAISRRERGWWERVLRYFEELGEVNPEEGHYMERFWWAVFDEGVAVRW